MKKLFVFIAFYQLTLVNGQQTAQELNLINQSIEDIVHTIQQKLAISDKVAEEMIETEKKAVENISDDDIYTLVEAGTKDLSIKHVSKNKGLLSGVCKNIIFQFFYYKDNKCYVPQLFFNADHIFHIMQKLNISRYLIDHPNVTYLTSQTSMTPLGKLCESYIILAEIVKNSACKVSDKYVYIDYDNSKVTSVALQFELNKAYNLNDGNVDCLFMPIQIDLHNGLICSTKIGTVYCTQQDLIDRKLNSYEKYKTQETPPLLKQKKTINHRVKNTKKAVKKNVQKKKSDDSTPLDLQDINYRFIHSLLFDKNSWNESLNKGFTEEKANYYMPSDFTSYFPTDTNAEKLRQEITTQSNLLRSFIDNKLKKYINDKKTKETLEHLETTFFYGIKSATQNYTDDTDMLKLLCTALRYNIMSLSIESTSFSYKELKQALSSSSLKISNKLRTKLQQKISTIEETKNYSETELKQLLQDETTNPDDIFSRLTGEILKEYIFVLHSSFFDFIVEYMACGILDSFYKYQNYWYTSVVPQILTSLNTKLLTYEQKAINAYPIRTLLHVTERKAIKDGQKTLFDKLNLNATQQAASLLGKQVAKSIH